jgi:Lar family restriction alleviation protein
MTKLKRCPFCGGEAEIETTDKNGWIFYYAQCNKCNIGTYDSTTNLKEVIDLWNTRTPEIIRCGECIYWEPENCRNPNILNRDQQMTYDDFCSWGERREEK